MPDRQRNRFGSLLVLGVLAVACGNGGGGGGGDGDPSDEPTLAELQEASRFLAQASLGASYEEIERVARTGPERWLEEQLDTPPSPHLPLFLQLREVYADPENQDLIDSPIFRQFAWWERVMTAPDVLRQRVALALSEIFVVSDVPDLLFLLPGAIASYYDVLLEHAFGSYEELLLDVSLHPAMGIYLSHLNNQRGDPDLGRFPDENYAREVMQLFSIGLVELAADGRPLLDDDGSTIPTYGNREITEMAKVFTGLGLQGGGSAFGAFAGDFTRPMVMYQAFHEPGEKELLGGFVIPEGQSGMKDVEDAVGHLADHPNTGPFIALRLIQRLVTSNPTPAYVERIARVFGDDGRGRRGNLGAVVRAILLDREALEPASPALAGHLREPFLRWVSLLRAFEAGSTSGRYFIDSFGVGFLLGQLPMSSPSVFNFFQPDFAPDAAFREAGLVAPEFQIVTSSTAILWANVALFLAAERGLHSETGRFEALRLTRERRLAAEEDPRALIDRLDLLLTHGNLSEGTRNVITDNLSTYEDAELRLVFALYLFLISPDWNVVQ